MILTLFIFITIAVTDHSNYFFNSNLKNQVGYPITHDKKIRSEFTKTYRGGVETAQIFADAEDQPAPRAKKNKHLKLVRHTPYLFINHQHMIYVQRHHTSSRSQVRGCSSEIGHTFRSLKHSSIATLLRTTMQRGTGVLTRFHCMVF